MVTPLLVSVAGPQQNLSSICWYWYPLIFIIASVLIGLPVIMLFCTPFSSQRTAQVIIIWFQSLHLQRWRHILVITLFICLCISCFIKKLEDTSMLHRRLGYLCDLDGQL